VGVHLLLYRHPHAAETVRRANEVRRLFEESREQYVAMKRSYGLARHDLPTEARELPFESKEHPGRHFGPSSLTRLEVFLADHDLPTMSEIFEVDPGSDGLYFIPGWRACGERALGAAAELRKRIEAGEALRPCGDVTPGDALARLEVAAEACRWVLSQGAAAGEYFLCWSA